MAVTKIKPIKGTLNKALDYIQNPAKTDEKMLVSSFGCSYETADIEFGFTLSQALDKGSNLAHHLIQAFEPGEVDYQTAHEIGRQLADAVTKGQHEYVLTTHIDKGHIHNHIIFCAVNFVDHHKYNSNKRSYYGIRNMSDKLCRDNGLSVVVPGKGSKGKSYAEYQAEKTGTSWKGKLKIAVDALIPQVSSFEELLQRLQAAGYEIKPGKYISCRAPGQERFTRLKTLGTDYTEEAIKERIAGKRTRAAKAPKAERKGVNLLIDIEHSIKAQQSRGYEQWAKIHNLKQAAKTISSVLVLAPVSAARGVGNINPHDKSSLTFMPCADGTSRKYECPNCISRLCQVKERFVEPHIDEVSNIFAKHVMGPEFANDAAHFRPEVAGVLKPLFRPDTGKGLAGEAAGEQREFFLSCLFIESLLCQIMNVPETRHVWPVPFQYRGRVVCPLALADGCEACGFGGYVYAAYPGKQA